MSEYVSFRDFEILVMAESAAETDLRKIVERPHMTYPIPGMKEADIRWLRARAKVIRAAVLLDPKDLEAEPEP